MGFDKSKEYILCAAIWYKEIPIKKHFEGNTNPVNCKEGLVFCGHRHPHCMHTMSSVTGLRSVTVEVGEYKQGFLTSKNRFVDRKEGAIIHLNNGGQLNYHSNQLFSEDLY